MRQAVADVTHLPEDDVDADKTAEAACHCGGDEPSDEKVVLEWLEHQPAFALWRALARPIE